MLATDVEHLRRIRKLLAGGDRRSIGRSAQVVADVLAHPERFGAVIAAISGDDPVIRMRAADVAEKITAQRPESAGALQAAPPGRSRACLPAEVRWHVAQMLLRLTLAEGDHHAAWRSSSTTSTITTGSSPSTPCRPSPTSPVLEPLTERGSPAIRARGRKLLAALQTR
jgi:hypothetical protein